jgi:AAA family ATP:ADP antiporter
MATAAGATPEDPGAKPRSWLENFLGLFAEVRAGEAGTALLLMLTVFLLFTAYYILKPTREALILQGGATQIFGWTVGKPQIKSYASGAMAILLLFVVRYYGKLASAVPRQKLVTYVTLFFISNIIVFYLLAKTAVTAWLGIAFFIWVGIFNNMVVSQFWAFANDIYRPEQGKRLFAIVGFGASSGAVGGSWVAGKLVVLGEAQMLLWAAVILFLCIVVTNVVHHREAANRRAALAMADPEAPVAPSGGGFQLVFSQRYLLLIAVMVLVANIVNTNGEFILGKKVSEAASLAVASGAAGGLKEGQWIGRFYSGYNLWTSILTAVLQLFIVSRILKYAGVRAALFVLPAVALCGYTVLAFGAAIGLVRIVKIVENSCDYSVQNTTKQALFLLTTRAVKYKAKAAIDTFFVRIGDFVSALCVLAGTLLDLSTEQFALVNMGLVLVWIGLASGVARQYAQRSVTAPAAPADPVVAPA